MLGFHKQYGQMGKPSTRANTILTPVKTLGQVVRRKSDWFNEECTKAANVLAGNTIVAKLLPHPFQEPQFLFRPHVMCYPQCSKGKQAVSSAICISRAEGRHLLPLSLSTASSSARSFKRWNPRSQRHGQLRSLTRLHVRVYITRNPPARKPTDVTLCNVPSVEKDQGQP